jgi:hypothetical protein
MGRSIVPRASPMINVACARCRPRVDVAQLPTPRTIVGAGVTIGHRTTAALLVARAAMP